MGITFRVRGFVYFYGYVNMFEHGTGVCVCDG